MIDDLVELPKQLDLGFAQMLQIFDIFGHFFHAQESGWIVILLTLYNIKIY